MRRILPAAVRKFPKTWSCLHHSDNMDMHETLPAAVRKFPKTWLCQRHSRHPP